MSENGDRRVVVITGASAGVGRATAQAFGRRGALVGLIARGEKGLEGTKQEIEAAGGQALAISADVSDAEQVERAAEKIESTFGPIDVWVNNAMVSVFSPFEEIEPEEFRRVTEVTYLGVVYGTRSALKRMLPRNSGKIVQVGSALSKRSIPLQSAYCGAKSAIVGFTDSVRCELHHKKSRVSVTIVQMPALNTPQFDWTKSRLPRKAQPVPPIFQPEVAAENIVIASESNRRDILVGFSTLQAIWGNKFIPGLLDRYFGKTGYDAQQTDERDNKNRKFNLFEPVPGDFGAHGRFDSRAGFHKTQVWISRNIHRLMLAGAVLLVALIVLLIVWI